MLLSFDQLLLLPRILLLCRSTLPVSFALCIGLLACNVLC
jgi:hypothetical protein